MTSDRSQLVTEANSDHAPYPPTTSDTSLNPAWRSTLAATDER